MKLHWYQCLNEFLQKDIRINQHPDRAGTFAGALPSAASQQHTLPAVATLLKSVTVNQICQFLNFVSGGLVWNVLFLDLASFLPHRIWEMHLCCNPLFFFVAVRYSVVNCNTLCLPIRQHPACLC